MDARLVTCAACMPGGDYDSVPLLEALRDLGLRVDIRAWDDPATDWSDAVVTIIRSTWDYHHDVRRFLDWAVLAAQRTQLLNRPSTIRWNVHKSYLIDLEHRGVPIVPTIAVQPGSASHAASAMAGAGWDDVVIKPAVSLDGHGVIRAAAASAKAIAGIARICETTTAIVQPFVPEITSTGELSLAFVDGRFAHAVRKRPAAGEFRVQERLGGTVEPARAPARAVELANRVLATLDETPLYARVDVIESTVGAAGEGFLLTELELVEPSLFLAASERTADLFARAIAARLTA